MVTHTQPSLSDAALNSAARSSSLPPNGVAPLHHHPHHHHHHHHHRHNGAYADDPARDGIQDVWAYNLESQMRAIRAVRRKFPYVAMDTEFPGVVARPLGEFASQSDYQYQLLRCNVSLLKLIQVGLTFMNEKGEIPQEGISTWQFNFTFNLEADMFAQDSINLLQHSGLQFIRHRDDGIDPLHFGEFLLTSGIVLNDYVTWLSFHSGYDFGYLLKLLTNQELPDSEEGFFDVLKIYFPKIYDVKYMMRSCKSLKGGLQDCANDLQINRIGPQHQAGSDSLLTGKTFFKMKTIYFEENVDAWCGILYGLGACHSKDALPYELSDGLAANGVERPNSTSSKGGATTSKSGSQEDESEGSGSASSSDSEDESSASCSAKGESQ